MRPIDQQTTLLVSRMMRPILKYLLTKIYRASFMLNIEIKHFFLFNRCIRFTSHIKRGITVVCHAHTQLNSFKLQNVNTLIALKARNRITYNPHGLYILRPTLPGDQPREG